MQALAPVLMERPVLAMHGSSRTLTRDDILPMWRFQKMDTLAISSQLGISEANVYNIIFGRQGILAPAPLPVATDHPARPVVDANTEVKITVPNWKGVVLDVLVRHQVGMGEFMGEGRTRRIAAARHEAMFIMSRDLGMTLEQIGRRLNKDFATVHGGIRAHSKRLAEAQGRAA